MPGFQESKRARVLWLLLLSGAIAVVLVVMHAKSFIDYFCVETMIAFLSIVLL